MATLETPGLQLDVLEALAETPPTHLVQPVGPDGQTKLRFLYAQAAAADLVPQTAADDIGRLHSLFDVALDHGLGGLILDYIAEVRRAAGQPIADPLPTPAAAQLDTRAAWLLLPGSFAGLLRPQLDLQRPAPGLFDGRRLRAALGAEAAVGRARPPCSLALARPWLRGLCGCGLPGCCVLGAGCFWCALLPEGGCRGGLRMLQQRPL
jgi:hypothetical protein